MATRHGLSKHRLMSIWSSMMTRCYNPKSIAYQKYYGSKGVKVWERWHVFINFYNDVINDYNEGLTMDRWPNTKGNYEPGNIRWVTYKKQARNISCNIIVDYNGERMCIGELAEKVNMPYDFLHNRIVGMGWDVEKAINTPNKYANSTVEYNGEKKTIKQLADEYNVNYKKLYYRIRDKKWTPEKAIAKLLNT